MAADPAAAWREHAQRVREALTDDVAATPYEGFFGPSTVGETFDQFYVWDMVVHRWDVARTAGMDAPFSDEELDRTERGIEGFGPALYMEGICRTASSPARDRTTRLLARLGRRAQVSASAERRACAAASGEGRRGSGPRPARRS